MANKIALYGGSFDPPHVGHLQVIKTALKTLDIDTLFVIPNYLNPFKSSVKADGKTRLEWLQKMCERYPDVIVSDYEIKQQAPTPSIQTVTHFAKKYDKIYFIIGSDNLPKLQRWKEFKKLDSLVEWVVATRAGFETNDYKTLLVDVDISSTTLREKLDERYIPKEIYKDVKEFYE